MTLTCDLLVASQDAPDTIVCWTVEEYAHLKVLNGRIALECLDESLLILLTASVEPELVGVHSKLHQCHVSQQHIGDRRDVAGVIESSARM